MGKYDLLTDHLARQPFGVVPMTFAEIEHTIGCGLPPAASNHRAWWSNNPSNNVMTKAWLAAGFRSEQVDMAARRLVFRRAAAPLAVEPAAATASSGRRSGEGRASSGLFGCLKGEARIAVDLDLAAPVEAGWGLGE